MPHQQSRIKVWYLIALFLSGSQIFLEMLRGFPHIQPRGGRRSKEANVHCFLLFG
jgi:hypothetical protein